MAMGKELFRRRNLLPLALVVIGVLNLNGCLIVPATHLFQTNGKRTPDALIGKDSSKPVVLGKTKIEDALIILVNQSYGHVDSILVSPYSAKTALWTMNNTNEFEVTYVVKTSTSIWPLCFASFPDGYARRLRLNVDGNGVVQSFEDYKPDDGYAAFYRTSRFDQVDNVFDAKARKKLEDAGLLPDKQALEQMRASEAAATTRINVRATNTRPAPTSQP